MPRRRAVPATVVAVACSALVAGAGAAPARAAMPSTVGLGARGGVAVLDLTTGRSLLDRRGGTRRIPASVTKLFTVSAALRRLGPDWAPRTQVLATGQGDGTTWNGDLYLVGGGDPTLGRAALRALAGRTVQALGATRLSGRLHVDASAFDGWLGGYRTGRRADPDMTGHLGALTVDRGLGTSDPAGRAGALFRTALKSAGLGVAGTVGSGRAPATAAVVATQAGPPLSELAAATLAPSDNFFAETLDKDLASRDAVDASCRIAAGLTAIPPTPAVPETPADVACRAQAFPVPAATTTTGTAGVRTVLRPLLGVTPRLHDGSGLTRQNRVSPDLVVRLLQGMDADPALSPVLRASLAQAGRSGTLAGRMRGTAAVGRCAAKTGTITGVSGLAGYCTTKAGRQVAFAILQNSGDVAASRRFQDRFVARLAARG